MATSDRLEQMVGDLVQIVESAKAVPMSASCVINRAEVLEVLHELAEGVAQELAESRRLIGALRAPRRSDGPTARSSQPPHRQPGWRPG